MLNVKLHMKNIALFTDAYAVHAVSYTHLDVYKRQTIVSCFYMNIIS